MRSVVPVEFLEGIDDKLSLGVRNYISERSPGHRLGFLHHLKRWRQMLGADNLAVTQQDRPLDAVLQFSNIARPMVTCKHLDCRRRNARNVLVVFGGQPLEEVVRQA